MFLSRFSRQFFFSKIPLQNTHKCNSFHSSFPNSDRSRTTTIKPITPTIGAEITGIDLREPLTVQDADAIYEALLDHQVIFFRDQNDLSPESHLRLAKMFGEPEPPHPTYPHAPENPSVMVLEHGPNTPKADTDGWHTDLTWRGDVPFATLLYSCVSPRIGGDTLWSSMSAAYENLPQGMKETIADLRAIHDLSDFRNNFTVGEEDGQATKLMGELASGKWPMAIHPLVQPHPVTGVPHLYCNEGFTMQIVGWRSSDSRRLLNYLFDHMRQAEFQVRFRWTPGTLCIWDNRCTMHLAVSDYFPQHRKMHRVTITNDLRAPTNPTKTQA
jgi:taurine dioxygenase